VCSTSSWNDCINRFEVVLWSMNEISYSMWWCQVWLAGQAQKEWKHFSEQSKLQYSILSNHSWLYHHCEGYFHSWAVKQRINLLLTIFSVAFAVRQHCIVDADIHTHWKWQPTYPSLILLMSTCYHTKKDPSSTSETCFIFQKSNCKQCIGETNVSIC